MATTKLSIAEIIENHKPKNFKYRFVITDESVFDELGEDYNLDNLDTINDDMLVNAALKADFTDYGRETVAKAKEPTILDNGVMLSKKMVTKADKKLKCVSLGFFDYNNQRHAAILLKYERFDILEVFILV